MANFGRIKLMGGVWRGGRTDDVTEEQQCSTNILERKNGSKVTAHHLFDLKIFKINVCGSSYERKRGRWNKLQHASKSDVSKISQLFFPDKQTEFLNTENIAGFTNLSCSERLDVH